MACGQRETVTISYWGVCWKWIFPYPCKKHKQVQKYRYDFRPWRTRFSYSPFRRSYEACCGGFLFAWSYWTWSPFGSGNGPWVDTDWLYYSDSVVGGTGEDCPFQPPSGPIG